jgi:hypothetical protein
MSKLGSTLPPHEKKFPYQEPLFTFAFFEHFFFFPFNPCGLKNRFRSLRTEAKNAHSCFHPLFLLWGKSPETPQRPPTLESVQSSEANDPSEGKRPLLSTAGSP